MDDLTTEHGFDSQGMWVIDVFGLFFFEMLSMDVYTTRHWQTSGQRMQELNVSNVFCLMDQIWSRLNLA